MSLNRHVTYKEILKFLSKNHGLVIDKLIHWLLLLQIKQDSSKVHS